MQASSSAQNLDHDISAAHDLPSSWGHFFSCLLASSPAEKHRAHPLPAPYLLASCGVQGFFFCLCSCSPLTLVCDVQIQVSEYVFFLSFLSNDLFFFSTRPMMLLLSPGPWSTEQSCPATLTHPCLAPRLLIRNENNNNNNQDWVHMQKDDVRSCYVISTKNHTSHAIGQLRRTAHRFVVLGKCINSFWLYAIQPMQTFDRFSLYFPQTH